MDEQRPSRKNRLTGIKGKYHDYRKIYRNR